MTETKQQSLYTLQPFTSHTRYSHSTVTRVTAIHQSHALQPFTSHTRYSHSPVTRVLKVNSCHCERLWYVQLTCVWQYSQSMPLRSNFENEFKKKTPTALQVRGGADKSSARLTSRCRRTESIVSLERGVCSCVELQVFSCYKG